jgi:hypothetical protein
MKSENEERKQREFGKKMSENRETIVKYEAKRAMYF